MLTIAIGDIHGMFHELETLLEHIDCIIETKWRYDRFKLIFLGDYIDRGPHSKQVIKKLRSLESENYICLKGNHEEMMIKSVSGETEKTRFLVSGGEASIQSYGGFTQEFYSDLAWMTTLSTSYEDDKRFFVHAGIDPDAPLSDQSDEAKLWIRRKFIVDDRRFEKYVVHGHTPTTKNPPFTGRADIRLNRCNLDSGACYGGALTAAFFNDIEEKPFHLLYQTVLT
jgi:serine/threonine protein phosphatase 1